MGATVSSASHPDVDDSLASSPHLVRLYSRQFERDEIEEQQPRVDTTELYLNDYGDEPDEVATPDEVVQPVVSLPAEDDDYPTDRMTLREEPEIQEQRTPSPDIPSDIHRSFETSRSEKQTEFDSKYPKLPERPSACHAERDLLMKCYKDKEDILECREAVETYSRCAKSYSASRT